MTIVATRPSRARAAVLEICGDGFAELLDVIGGLQFLRRRVATAMGWQDGAAGDAECARLWTCATMILHQTVAGGTDLLPLDDLGGRIACVAQQLHPPRVLTPKEASHLLRLLDEAIAAGYGLFPTRAIVLSNYNNKYESNLVLSICQ